MKQLAGQMGYQFENSGVTAKLSNLYYPGTAWTQAMEIARDCNFGVGVDRGTMVITAPGKARQGDTVLISPQTGMVGYPVFHQSFLIVRSLYNSAVKFQGKIKVESDLTPACGNWQVNSMVYELDAMMPNGRWFMVLDCVNLDAQAPQ